MKNVSGVQWQVSWAPGMSALIGRKDEIHTPDGFSATPGNTPDEPVVTEMEVPDLEGPEQAG